MDSFFQEIWELKLHLAWTPPFELDAVIKADGSQDEGQSDGDQVDHPGEDGQEGEVLEESEDSKAD